MLPRANRLQASSDFAAVRRDGRTAGSALVGVAARFRPESPDQPARFGFVVSRRVGKAVTRNLVKRRLRATARDLVDGAPGFDVVVTARPPAAAATFADLAAATASGVRRATARRVPADRSDAR